MTDVDIAGAGIWSQTFGNWDEFQDALAGREVEAGGALKPELIPASTPVNQSGSTRLSHGRWTTRAATSDSALRVLLTVRPPRFAKATAGAYGSCKQPDRACCPIPRMP